MTAAGLETFWRARGHRPSATDSADLWSFHRARISLGGERSVVLLGASRIQVGIVPEVFEERFPDHRLTQLAIPGRAAVAPLLDIADEPSFRGVLVCSFTASHFQQEFWSDQQHYVDHYHQRYAWHRGYGTLVQALLQETLAISNPQLRSDKVLYAIASGLPLPRAPYVTMLHDRCRSPDYSLIDVAKHRRRRIEKLRSSVAKYSVPQPDEWLQDVARLDTAVRAIQDRGGTVVFVRFPTSEEHWLIDELRYPKALYWDRMAAATSAKTIHFMDVPSLRVFDLPDTSHVDYRDAPELTQVLLRELVRCGALDSGVCETDKLR